MVTTNTDGLRPTMPRAAEPDATVHQDAGAPGTAPSANRGLRGRSPRERGGHRSLIG